MERDCRWVQPDQLPERKPAILAAYQSADEAKAELGLMPLGTAQDSRLEPTKNMPGGRPIDLVVAVRIHRMVHEPDIADPEEAFLVAVKLAESDRFQRARRNLFDWEDQLHVDSNSQGCPIEKLSISLPTYGNG
jgi:hypothetical protein